MLTTAYLNLCHELNLSEANSSKNFKNEDLNLTESKNPDKYSDEFSTFDRSIAAEPFEIYKWSKVSQSALPTSDTVLIGCYRDKKHLEWILSHKIYNIRLGKRKGSSENHPDCFRTAKRLYLYNPNMLEVVSVFNIMECKERSRAEMKELGYPRKSPGKKYMTFKITPVEDNDENQALNVVEILYGLPNHTKGAPVFIEHN